MPEGVHDKGVQLQKRLLFVDGKHMPRCTEKLASDLLSVFQVLTEDDKDALWLFPDGPQNLAAGAGRHVNLRPKQPFIF